MHFTVGDGMRERRGQLALIAVIMLAATLIALVSLRTPNPYVAYERGHLQAAQLIHLARACFSTTCDCSRLQSLITIVTNINGSEPLRVYPTFSPCTAENPLNRTARFGRGWLTEYQVKFTLATPGGGEYVTYYARVENLGVEGTYTKTVIIGSTAVNLHMVKVRLKYTNTYTTPFFNASLCPLLTDPQGVADILSFDSSSCEWLLGVSKELSTMIPVPSPESSPAPSPQYVYKLKDRWGVIVLVYHRGG